MTSEEIKEQYSMSDVVGRYGLKPNRSGFIKCPFHKGDNSPSMKIYDDSFYCFGCGASGDIFSFIMRMGGCSFREAYVSLGGTYEHSSFKDTLERYHAIKARETRRKNQEKIKRFKQIVNEMSWIYRKFYEIAEPFSDLWCESYNMHQKLCYLSDYLNTENEVR